MLQVLLSLLCACLPADARRSEVQVMGVPDDEGMVTQPASQVEESLAMQRIDALEAKVLSVTIATCLDEHGKG